MKHMYRTDVNGRSWLFLYPERETPRLRVESEIGALIDHTGITLAQIRGGSRAGPVCMARWMAMYHLVKNMGYGYAEAGRFLKKDHTAVLYGYAKVHFSKTGEALPILLKRSKQPSGTAYAHNIPPLSLRCSLAA